MLIINKKLAVIFALNTFLLSACNETQQSKPAVQKVEQYTATSVLIFGKVAKASNVEALDEMQNVIVSTATENGRYKIEIPAQTKLPIILRAGNFISVVVDTDLKNYDINNLTTEIAEKAKALGGYTRQNMVVAASNSVHTPDANKTSTGWRGDTTSQYGGWH